MQTNSQFEYANEKLVLIVNHFQHDVKWTKNVKHKVVIYNKNEKFNHLFRYNLPNVGFDTIAYLRFIVDNYDGLPEYIAFSQDDPFYHCTNLVDIVNNFEFDKEFVPMGISWILGDWDIEKTIKYANLIELKYEEPLKFINACQCIVSRDLILNTPKSMYERIISTISMEVLSHNNFCIEYLWPTILNFNQELIPTDTNCAGGGWTDFSTHAEIQSEPIDDETYF